MGAFSYRALDGGGKLIKGVLEADSERQVRAQLRARALKPVEVVAVAGGEGRSTSALKTSGWRGLFKPRIAQRDLALLTRQLATLIQSNLPIDEALNATAQQARKPRIKGLMLQVRARVLEGHTLAYALGDFPQVFDEMYRAMVRAGESAGFLGSVLERLADYTENSQYTRQKLMMAMIYPIILMCLMIVVLGVVVFFVIPRFNEFLKDFNQDLPLITKVLVAFALFCRGNWPFLLGGVIAAVIVGPRPGWTSRNG